MSEFRAVMAFLEKHGYRIVKGYGRDEESKPFAGHTIRQLGELYDRERSTATHGRRNSDG